MSDRARNSHANSPDRPEQSPGVSTLRGWQPRCDGRRVPNYVVERYRSRSDPDSLGAVADRLAAGARRVSQDGTSVRYVDTIFLPGDEICLHTFEADSATDVRAVLRLVGIEIDRIVPAEQIESREIGSSFHGPVKEEAP